MKTKLSGTAVIKHTGISEEDRDIRKGEEILKANDLVQFTKLLAREIGVLESNVVISSKELVTRDLDNEFVELNDTIQVQIPATLTAQDFTYGSNISIQDYENGKIGIKMDRFFDISVSFTQNELDQALEKGQSKVISSMGRAIRQKIDNYVAIVIKNGVSGYAGTSGTTMSTIAHVAALERMLNVEDADEMDRALVLDSYAKEKLVILPEYKNLDMTGSTAGLFNSNLGKKFTLEHYTTNNVPTHTAGGFATVAAVTYLATCVLANDGVMDNSLIPYSTITITESGGASILKLLKGDLMTFSDDGGVVQQRVVLADSVAAIAGVVSVRVYALPTAVSANALTFADKTAGASVRNLVWQKNGVMVVARPITPAIGMQSISMSTPEGYPLRLTWGYNPTTKVTTMSMDCAVKAIVVQNEVVKCQLG